MFFLPREGKGLLFLVLLLLIPCVSLAAAQDSLILYNPQLVSLNTTGVASTGNFIVYLTFKDIPDSIGALIHAPDLTGWGVVTPDSLLSIPHAFGAYNGDRDITIVARVLNSGVLGDSASIEIQYEIQGEEDWRNIIDIGASFYNPGDTIDWFFINQVSGDTMDLGIKFSFTPGVVDSNGVFFLGCEDFEGFHIWRGVYDGSGNLRDIEIIGEVSKEEAFSKSFCDSLYFYDVVPELRRTGSYFFDPGVVCISTNQNRRLDMPLGDDEFFWVDYNAFNGFSYGYAVSTFDRGYNVSSRRQGLFKIDSFAYCNMDPDTATVMRTLPCPDLFTRVDIEVQPQNNLRKIYVVPNPYRTGGSAYTTPNYHNYPDNKVRFVNVPSDCKLSIYTTAGDLVWEIDHHSTSGNIAWDTRNRSGEEVASGVYIFKIEDSKGESLYGKLIIIR